MTGVEAARAAIASGDSGSRSPFHAGGCSPAGASGSNGSGAPPSARNAAQLALELRLEPVPSERAHQELQTVPLLVLVVAEPVVDADDGFRDVEHLADRQELVEHVAGARQRRRAAGDGHAESALRPSVDGLHARLPADVVDGQRDVIVGAALERNLELPRQRRAERMAQQIAGQRFGIRRDVERFVARDARRTGTR